MDNNKEGQNNEKKVKKSSETTENKPKQKVEMTRSEMLRLQAFKNVMERNKINEER